jgi:hypothetical protein
MLRYFSHSVIDKARAVPNSRANGLLTPASFFLSYFRVLLTIALCSGNFALRNVYHALRRGQVCYVTSQASRLLIVLC